VGHMSISDGLLRLKASHARVSYSALKTGGVTTMSDVREIITEVALRGSWRRTSRCDRLYQTLLP
jgi:hypothetical protein